jgi:beta-galactosidase/beta-glucuronidase
LYAAGEIPNPLMGRNWLNSSIWSQDWTYTTQFALPPGFEAASEVLLVADGVKMGAAVSLNGKNLGRFTDQFLRVSFPLKASGVLMQSGASNTLDVRFDSSIVCDGRWMACSGGWDWVS